MTENRFSTRRVENLRQGRFEKKRERGSRMTSETQKPPRRYEKMRDSGVEWIGMVPEHWQVQKAKRFVVITNGSDPKTEGNIPVYGSGVTSFKTCGEYKIGPAVLVGRKGSINNPRYVDGLFWNVDTAFDVKSKNESAFLTKYYFYLSVCFDYNYYSSQTTLPSMTQESYNNMFLPYPPVSVQQCLVDYLGEKCNQIDQIVADIKASIEEYKAWKASIIYEAVTKGLDPHAEMKDSGVEWIGKIPEEWYVCKTLFVLQMPITDGPHTTPELYAAGVPFVSAEAVSCGNGRIDFNHIRGYISEGFYQECCKKYIPQKDDIYMIKSGATTGKVAIVDVDTKFTIWSPLAAFRVNPKKVLPRYLFYFLQSPAYQKQVELGWSFGTQQNIGMRTLEKLKICVPPLSVQQEIIRYLDEKSNKLDAIIKEKTDLISDLESYKKSLIYEVVTGKRRVC